jgi:drug/metabolite transporter (DMT)-like permease
MLPLLAYLCPMSNTRKSIIFALLAVLFWSTMSSAFKISLGYLSPFGLLFWSVLFALLSLFLVMLVQQKFRFLKELSQKDLMRSAAMGFVNPFLYYLVLFKAYSLLRAQEAGMLNYTWPIVLVLLSVIFLKQRIGFLSIIAVVVSFLGILVISSGGRLLDMRFDEPFGVALAIGSAFLWAFYWVLNMKDKREAVGKIFVNMLFGFVYLLLYGIIFEEIQIPSAEGLLGTAYIGFFEMGITFVFWLLALQYAANTAHVSNLIFLSPFMALFFISIFVGERILPSTVVGLLLIISGIMLQQFGKTFFSWFMSVIQTKSK